MAENLPQPDGAPPDVEAVLARVWIDSPKGRLMAGAEISEWIPALAAALAAPRTDIVARQVLALERGMPTSLVAQIGAAQRCPRAVIAQDETRADNAVADFARRLCSPEVGLSATDREIVARLAEEESP